MGWTLTNIWMNLTSTPPPLMSTPIQPLSHHSVIQSSRSKPNQARAKRPNQKPQRASRWIMHESDNEPAHLHAVPERLTTSFTHTTFPTNGLSETQLELLWRLQTKNTDLSNKVPLVSSTQCTNCKWDHVICWTVAGCTTCLNCRYVKKSCCPNVGPP
jgi:hypothetical protein